MWGNYLKVALRNIFRQKGYSFINIFGLAIGIAISLLIFLYVQDEISYDRYHENADCIYRLELRSNYQGEEYSWAASQGNLVPLLEGRYPEVKSACKILFSFNSFVIQYHDQVYNEENVLSVDSTFLDIFTYDVIYGSTGSALSGPDNIILTHSMAKKYFGNKNPVGEMLIINDDSFKISSVIEDVPVNSHFSFDFLMPLDYIRTLNPRLDDGGPYAFYTYIKTNSPDAHKTLQTKLDEDVWELLGYTVTGDSANIPTDFESRIVMNPIEDIHLTGHAEKEINANSNIKYVFIFSAIAVFVLIIACINYMNLATAKSFRRGKEVGVRKVLGAQRSNIIKQFLSESVLISLIAVVFAVVMVELILPSFNTFTGKELDLSLLNNLPLLMLLLGIMLLTGFLSGSYPAFVLSSFSPIKVLKSNTPSGANKTSLYLRRGLVIFQFAISVLLIIVTLTVYNQLDFINNKELGFDKNNVMVLRLPGNNREKTEVLKNELLKNADVQSVSSASVIPGERVHFITVSTQTMKAASTNPVKALKYE